MIAASPQEGDVQLTGLKAPSEGRLEIFHAGAWGTVCSRHWGANSAGVVCRQLGFVRAAKVSFGGGMDRGDDDSPVWLSEIQCRGSEKELQECFNSANYGSHTCSHEQDIHITCSGV